MNRFFQYAVILLIFCLNCPMASAQDDSMSDVEITECETEQCFAIKFKTCDPASYTIVTSMGTAKYEILGQGEDGCRVKLIYLENPNPNWENKALICTYNNSLEFKVAAKRVLIAAMQGTGKANCEGALLHILSGK